uniref:Uncharacterized protein n=1 Tax=Wuchereria bancrofti TaxID=6293 RepID=A0A1I8EY41_WUCBA
TIHWIKIYEINRINQVIREDDNIPDDFEWLLFGYKKPMQPSAVKTPSVRGTSANTINQAFIDVTGLDIKVNMAVFIRLFCRHYQKHQSKHNANIALLHSSTGLEHTLVNTQEEDASSQSYNILDDFNLALFDSGTGTYGNTDEISS